jgi:hypothetical protein
MTDTQTEAQALMTRAADIEAQRQAALARGDVHAVKEHELELSRIWARYLDIEQQVA